MKPAHPHSSFEKARVPSDAGAHALRRTMSARSSDAGRIVTGTAAARRARQRAANSGRVGQVRASHCLLSAKLPLDVPWFPPGPERWRTCRRSAVSGGCPARPFQPSRAPRPSNFRSCVTYRTAVCALLQGLVQRRAVTREASGPNGSSALMSAAAVRPVLDAHGPWQGHDALNGALPGPRQLLSPLDRAGTRLKLISGTANPV
jgi:hypothetical protein